VKRSLRGCSGIHVIVAIVLLSVVAGCSSIVVSYHAVGVEPPLYRGKNSGEKIVVYWGTAWRDNQKEPSKREALAARGIEEFFSSNPRWETLRISKSVVGRDALLASDTEAVSEAKTAGADRVLIIRIEELGPNVMVYLSPILWQTQNEVLLHVRAINCQTGQVEADVSTRWVRGGPFTVIGADSLPIDLAGALKAVFFGRGTP